MFLWIVNCSLAARLFSNEIKVLIVSPSLEYQWRGKVAGIRPHKVTQYCDAGSMSRRSRVSQIMTDLSELLLIMIRAGISLLPQCQTLARSLITRSTGTGWASHHMLIYKKNTIQSQILWDNNNVTINCDVRPKSCFCRSHSAGCCCHKTQTFSRYKQNFREKSDFSDINYLRCYVCLPAASPVSRVHLLHLDNIQKLSCFHQDEVTWELKT